MTRDLYDSYFTYVLVWSLHFWTQDHRQDGRHTGNRTVDLLQVKEHFTLLNRSQVCYLELGLTCNLSGSLENFFPCTDSGWSLGRSKRLSLRERSHNFKKQKLKLRWCLNVFSTFMSYFWKKDLVNLIQRVGHCIMGLLKSHLKDVCSCNRMSIRCSGSFSLLIVPM